MAKPYSIDLRERVVGAVEPGGLSCHQAAAYFGAAVSTAINWVRRLRETGSGADGRTQGAYIWRAGIATGFLPPYSPGLNPIEQVFAKLKHLMRKAAGCTVEAIWQRIATLLDAFPSHEGAAYFANAEYEQT